MFCFLTKHEYEYYYLHLTTKGGSRGCLPWADEKFGGCARTSAPSSPRATVKAPPPYLPARSALSTKYQLIHHLFPHQPSVSSLTLKGEIWVPHNLYLCTHPLSIVKHNCSQINWTENLYIRFALYFIFLVVRKLVKVKRGQHQHPPPPQSVYITPSRAYLSHINNPWHVSKSRSTLRPHQQRLGACVYIYILKTSKSYISQSTRRIWNIHEIWLMEESHPHSIDFEYEPQIKRECQNHRIRRYLLLWFALRSIYNEGAYLWSKGVKGVNIKTVLFARGRNCQYDYLSPLSRELSLSLSLFLPLFLSSSPSSPLGAPPLSLFLSLPSLVLCLSEILDPPIGL